MSIFAPAPKPPSLLGYHRVLAPTAGVKVSPLCLGAMNFGDAWYESWFTSLTKLTCTVKEGLHGRVQQGADLCSA